MERRSLADVSNASTCSAELTRSVRTPGNRGVMQALTSYSVAVFNGGRERRQVVFGINVLSQNSTHAIYENNAREKD